MSMVDLSIQIPFLNFDKVLSVILLNNFIKDTKYKIEQNMEVYKNPLYIWKWFALRRSTDLIVTLKE